MRRILAVLFLALLLPSAAVADVVVRLAAEGRVDVRATAAPLTDVLDRLARTTGMKLVQEGPPQRQPVTVVLAGRTPAEAVLDVLDGLGLDYALKMDETGTRVETLILAGGAVAATPLPGTAPSPAAPSGFPRPMPHSVTAPAAPDTDEEAGDTANEEETEAEQQQPQIPAAAARAVPRGPQPQTGVAPATVTLPGPVGVTFPVSPFAPMPSAGPGAAQPAPEPPAEETGDSGQ